MAAALEGMSARIVGPNDKVHKDECAFSFDTPESPGGIFVCLNSFLAVSREFAALHHHRTGHSLFLHLRTIKHKVEPTEEEKEAAAAKPTKMAIGVEGGFANDAEKYEYEHVNNLVVYPDLDTLIPIADAPAEIQRSVESVLAAPTAAKVEEGLVWQEQRQVSAFAASLQQLDNGVKIPPSGWKCSMCDITDNLWLNLTDGTILCGRRYADGSGGNHHAIEHYNATKYPVAVKLGTITPQGADVFSYAEDDMVIDPQLDEHLAHFGINMAQMKKTVATMTEMEIELQYSLLADSASITESGKKLQPLYGPGYTGLRNLGNSCYMNSILQVVFSLEDFKAEFFGKKDAFFHSAPADPINDFTTQMAKVADGLLSGRYSQPRSEDQAEQDGIAPLRFKNLVGRGHPDFSTNQQQDAAEYFLHLMELLSRTSRTGPHANLSNSFKFEVEERLQCNVSQQVRYTTHDEMYIRLPADLDLAVNKDEVAQYEERIKAKEAAGDKSSEDPVRSRLLFETTISQLFAPETISDWLSPAIQQQTTATKTMRLKTFPRYLAIAVDKFGISADWTPFKKNISLPFPEELDLSGFAGTGLQPNETQMPEDQAPEAPAVNINPEMVEQLKNMGFPEEGCRRAVFNNPNSVDAAMEWIFAHMEDADFATPFVPPGAAAASQQGGDVVSDEGIMLLQSMGFSREQAIVALKATNNNIERAGDWIFSHVDELDALVAEHAAADSAPAPAHEEPFNGSGKYRLVGIVSHIGKSTGSGHYVAHVHKDGQWAIFNDEKVARSEDPPIDLGYLYFYESV